MEQKGRDTHHISTCILHRFELREAVRQLLAARATLGREGTQRALLMSCAAESGPQFVEVAEVCFV